MNLACERMKSADVKSLIVTDELHHVTGIVGRSTVIKALLNLSGS